MSVSIKISEENYRMLCDLSGNLRETFHKAVSLNDAISFLHGKRELSELAGSWKMSKREAEDILADTRRGWKKWKIRSV